MPEMPLGRNHGADAPLTDGGSVPRVQIVTNERAIALRDRAVRLPARLDSLKRAAREEDGTRQGAMDL